ncbi:MAG: hypothetical protein JW900_14665 [Anaerolineae bacterium]|nr:hypothetical protein [Anaerolineae bacterium]
MTEKEQGKKRQIGRYQVQEYTARRLVIEARRRPLLALGILWAIFVPIVALIGPWMGGTRLLIALTAAGAVFIASLLVLRFTPRIERIVVDVEAGQFRVERYPLFPRAKTVIQDEISAVKGVRCGHRVWRDPPNVQAEQWLIELVGEKERWLLTKGPDEEPIQKVARLFAEVSGRPFLEQQDP